LIEMTTEHPVEEPQRRDPLTDWAIARWHAESPLERWLADQSLRLALQEPSPLLRITGV
jgi:hypothetical protein